MYSDGSSSISESSISRRSSKGRQAKALRDSRDEEEEVELPEDAIGEISKQWLALKP